MLLHQPLLPLRRRPPTNALTIVPDNRMPVSVPLLLRKTRRAAAIPKNSEMATTKPHLTRKSGAVRPRVKPNRRGVWLDAAKGQMFRHRPGATKNRIGSSGMITLKNQNSPPAGRTNRATHKATYAATLTARIPCHRGRGIRYGTSV